MYFTEQPKESWQELRWQGRFANRCPRHRCNNLDLIVQTPQHCSKPFYARAAIDHKRTYGKIFFCREGRARAKRQIPLGCEKHEEKLKSKITAVPLTFSFTTRKGDSIGSYDMVI